MQVHSVVALLYIWFVFPIVCSHVRSAALPELMEWLVANGAKVHQGMTVGFFEHGGAKIRGVYDSEDLAANTPLLVVPRTLAIELSHFPAFSSAGLPSTTSCQKATGTVEALQGMRLAAAIAWEASKGDASLYHRWFKLLPSLPEFHSFLPVMMEKSVQKDYASLPIIAEVAEVQAGFEFSRRCFEDWKTVEGSPVKQLLWGNVFLALLWVNTRSFGFDGGRTLALVPAADMFNTGSNSELNAEWIAAEDTFALHSDRPIAAGAEIYEGYCNNCNNTLMLRGWGIYFEKNPNPSRSGGQSCLGAAGAHLKSAAEAALQTQEAAPDNLLSPRCKANVWDMPQGPLRCSLARVAWEMCAADWAAELASVHSSAASLGQTYPLISRHAQSSAATELSARGLRGRM